MDKAPFKRIFTEREYLMLEAEADYKSEFYQGEIFAMSGASLVHNIIANNLTGHFFNGLRGSGCQGFGSDTRIHIPSNSLYTYPDFSVVCGKAEILKQGKLETLLNPMLIIEILSESTADYDRGKKLDLYKGIHSLKQYVMVDSLSCKVESIERNNHDGLWVSSVFDTIEELVTFKDLGLKISLHDIYEKTEILLNSKADF